MTTRWRQRVPSFATSSGDTARQPAVVTPTPGAPEQAARAETRSTLSPDLKIEVVGLNRVRGKHLVAQLRLTNTGDDKKLPWTGEMGDSTRPLGGDPVGVRHRRARHRGA
ncbi:hypothetical protein ACIBF6_38105 [Streptosporangium amethystogenes]|uniref:hypothetical protein n=1 Tax=Streptosporangium amethystogenes TaxID=2002 RepID=UPI0037A7D504